MALNEKEIFFRYTFTLTDGKEKKFEVTLNPKTLEIVSPKPQDPPDWTRLDYFPCDHCPLIGTVSHCPVAVSLSTIVSEFRDTISHHQATVTVETPERSYKKETTVQKGLSAIIGICMVTSNCPVMDELRPMTKFHLPFATTEETLFRAVSYYLLRQYFVTKMGGESDWALDGLKDIYNNISTVNIGMSRRISNASQKDANINAIIILHTYGESIPFFIENELSELRYLFENLI